MPGNKTVEGFVIRNIEINRAEGKVSLPNVKDVPGICAKVFAEMAERKVNVNLIVQNSRADGTAFVTFTAPKEQLDNAKAGCEAIKEEVGAAEVEVDSNVATVSVIGIGMRSHTEVAGRTFAALGHAGVNIDMISTSEIEIEVVVRGDQAEKAQKALRKEFKAELEG